MKLSFVDTLERGVVAHKQGSLDEAERIYREIIDLQSKLVDADYDQDTLATVYNNLAYALQSRGELQTAVEYFQQAINIKPHFLEALNNLAFTQHLLADYDAAIGNYRKAIEINTDFDEAHFNLARVLLDKGDLNAAVECFRTVVENRPGDADALNALGAALQLNGDLDAAVTTYELILKTSPGYVEAYNNLAAVLQAKGDLDASISYCHRALEIKPDYANAWNNLGHALYDKDDLEAAIESYRRALELRPNSADAYNNLGNALKEAKQFHEAIECFEALERPDFKKAVESDPTKHLFWFNAKSQILECLYRDQNYPELTARLQFLAESAGDNRRVAAVSAFFAHQLEIENPHPFCRNPLDFFHIGDLREYTSDVDGFVADLLQEASQMNQMWEPQHGVTKDGYQTPNTVFRAGAACAELEKILCREMAAYHARFSGEDCEFINLWPAEFDLKGWLARLVKNGHQRSHIHPAGWLSGVVYLKTVEGADDNEGAIELSLHGYDLPVLNEDYPRLIHNPEKGQIILFPSSVFHRTIPFRQDTERSVIAFDALPVLTNSSHSQ